MTVDSQAPPLMLCLVQAQLPRAFPCGKCEICRRIHQRKWVGRCVAESMCHTDSSFLTLTYDPEHLVYSESFLPTLVRSHLTKFWKRLRFNLSSGDHGITNFRYFACGEYGDKSDRPHYHAIMFGVPAHPYYENLIQKTWGMGWISLAEFNPARAAYVAGYVLKKSVQDVDYGDRVPEYTTASRKPGLGQGYIEPMANAYMTEGGSFALAERGDIHPTFRYAGVEYPLDHYMKTKLREDLGIPTLKSEREILEPHRETPEKVEIEAYAKNIRQKLKRRGGRYAYDAV